MSEEENKVTMVEVSISAITKNLDKRGITWEIIEVPVRDADGNVKKDANGNDVTHKAVHILQVPEDESDAMDFISGKKCWFAGCEELRKKYTEEYEAAGGAEECPSCQKSKLMRKYIQLAKEAIKADKKDKYSEDGANGHTGAVEVPGPAGKGTSGAGEKPTLLRRATSRIKKILRACKE